MVLIMRVVIFRVGPSLCEWVFSEWPFDLVAALYFFRNGDGFLEMWIFGMVLTRNWCCDFSAWSYFWWRDFLEWSYFVVLWCSVMNLIWTSMIFNSQRPTDLSRKPDNCTPLFLNLAKNVRVSSPLRNVSLPTHYIMHIIHTHIFHYLEVGD